MANSPSHIAPLHGLRGLTALWVMLFHFAKLDGVHGSITMPSAIAVEGRLGVDIFFVLSGFVMAHVYTSMFSSWPGSRVYRQYLILRLARIYPLHFVTLLALVAVYTAAIQLGMPLGGTRAVNYDAILPNLFMVHAWGGAEYVAWNYVSWSISAEWFAYLFLLPLFVWAAERTRLSIQLIACGLGSFVLFTVIAVDPNGEGYRHGYMHALPMVTVEFYAGVTAYQIWKRCIWSAEFAESAVLAGVIVIIWIASNNGAERILLVPAIMLLIVGFAYASDVGKLAGCRFLHFLGDISYSLYMLHPMVMLISNFAIHLLAPAPSLGLAWLILALTCTGSLVVASLSYYVIERPCRNWIRNNFVSARPRRHVLPTTPKAI